MGSASTPNKAERLRQRLTNGNSLLVAEGYLFEFERRGYLKAGAFVPDVVLDHPDLVKALHEEFVHAGSDVVLAFTYYAHREKLRVIGKEDLLEKINKKALDIASEVAKATGTMLAGNICNTTIYRIGDEESIEAAKQIFKEQIEWAVEADVDFIVGETFGELAEAMLALETIKEFGQGIPAVITMAPTKDNMTVDEVPITDAMRQLEEAGAAVVGLNCARGVENIMPLMVEIRAACKGPVACLPVCYKTNGRCPTMHSLSNSETGIGAFPIDLPEHMYGRTAMYEFGRQCTELGIEYVGLCCGNCSHFLRAVAEAMGREPPASKYSPDMSKHFLFGDKARFGTYHTERMRHRYLKNEPNKN